MINEENEYNIEFVQIYKGYMFFTTHDNKFMVFRGHTKTDLTSKIEQCEVQALINTDDALFILIGIFGSDNRVKASFYLFLYTLLGSLFLLLSILAMSSIMSTTDFDTLFKGDFIYLTQLFLLDNFK